MLTFNIVLLSTKSVTITIRYYIQYINKKNIINKLKSLLKNITWGQPGHNENFTKGKLVISHIPTC